MSHESTTIFLANCRASRLWLAWILGLEEQLGNRDFNSFHFSTLSRLLTLLRCCFLVEAKGWT
jgi:hypothetical protein